MKALSIREPWASLFVSGVKTIEARSWKTDYRGELLLCCSLSHDCRSPEEFKVFEMSQIKGRAFAVANLKEIRPMVEADRKFSGGSFDKYAWVFENVRVLERPFRVAGWPGLFGVIPPGGLL